MYSLSVELSAEEKIQAEKEYRAGMVICMGYRKEFKEKKALLGR